MRKMHAAMAGMLVLTVVQAAWAVGGAIDGTLRDESGATLSNTKLVLQDGRGAVAGNTTSGTQGHYSFNDVAPGSYVVMAMQGEAMLGSMTVSVLDGTPVHKDLTLSGNSGMNVVIAQRRERARNDLSPRTGTNAYTIDTKALEALPQGDNTSFDKVLQQTPGAAQDSYGQTHIRGEHANLQYRLNGILLPEGVSGFGQVLDPHMMESATLLDGTLPAQYGYRTAGIVDVQTKSGFANGGTVEMYGGSNATLQPTVTYGGATGDTDYFFSGTHLSSDAGIEGPTSAANPIHDHTEQDKQFGYASFMLDTMQRVQVIAGNSTAHFQIPNNPGQGVAFTDGTQTTFDSSQLDETQFESNQYVTFAWQGENGPMDIQVAPYFRSSELHFRPDVTGDLMFNGIASDVKRSNVAVGLQTDGSYKLNAEHTLRSGFSFQQEHAISANTSQVFAVSGGTPSTTPETIVDNTHKDGQLYGVYVQDEWKLTPALTINYGARFDIVAAYINESQLSPRLGVVYKVDDKTTLHAGYARYFTPPPLELVTSTSISKFVGTTNEPAATLQNDAVKSERSHNFDIGATHQLTDEIQLGVDAYYKLVKNLLDEGQFGAALVYTPFNYDHGYIYGTELTVSYTGKQVKAYANAAFSQAMGQNIISGQFNFDDPAELAYIKDHYVHLDHDQALTISAGVTWQAFEDTAFGLDGIYGSGLRKGFANADSLPAYAQFNFSVTQNLRLFPKDTTQLRFTVLNLLDSVYELRDGSGIGVGAPQWGPRRGFFAGLSQQF